MTPAAIVGTGFMTSPSDREIIADNPELVAAGIADGIIDFLRIE
jgi:N-acetylmuramoyl-L-alanine amidase